jgi:hypothetical protein
MRSEAALRRAGGGDGTGGCLPPGTPREYLRTREAGGRG